jgi:hypothetical protein
MLSPPSVILSGFELWALGFRLWGRKQGVQHGRPMVIEVAQEFRPAYQPGGAGNYALRVSATPDYFSALGIDVLAGHTFADTDRAGRDLVAVVSEGYATAFGLRPDGLSCAWTDQPPSQSPKPKAQSLRPNS